jgi:pimeloyl-ACP methyl ester carboxylesterase
VKSQLVQVDNGSIYVESSGTGTAIVLIHAGYLDSRMWDKQFELFSRSYRVIRYDVRGFGNSSEQTGKYSDAADLRMVLDKLGVERAILIGVSNGGRIALDFAVENPPAVIALVLMDSGVSGYKPENTEEEHIWDQFEAHEIKYNQLVREGNFRGAAAIDVDLWTNQVPNKLRESLLDIAEENARKSSAYPPNLQTSPVPPAFERLAQIRVPVLVLLGSKDLPGSILQGKRIHRTIIGSEFKVIEGADHIPSLSRTEEFNTTVMEFLNRIAPLGENTFSRT